MTRQATPDLLGEPLLSEDPSLATMFGEMPPPQGSQALAKLSYAIHALAEARTLDEVKSIRNIAIAAQEYARAAKLGMDASNYAAEIRLRAERKAGELLADLERDAISRGGSRRPTLDAEPSEYRSVLDETATTRQDANRWQQIAELPVDVFNSALDHMKEIQKEISTSRLVRISRDFQRNGHVLNTMGSSENDEFYTPELIINGALALWGRIDLDPCSNSHSSPSVPARVLFTREDDGLAQPWHGRVYMNPPYTGGAPAHWVAKLIAEYETGNVTEALVLVPGRIDTEWFQPLYRFLICHVRGRVKFANSDVPSPFPSVVAYLGPRQAEFIEVFAPLGPIMRRVG